MSTQSRRRQSRQARDLEGDRTAGPAPEARPEPFRASRLQWLYPAIALACFVANLALSIRGWNLPLLDAHAFRQTQTALTAYWIAQEGLRLDYITPVLGPPWSIPMELPVYQWIVAQLHLLTGYGIDQCCRLVSVMFLYLTLLPAFRLATFYFKDTRAGWILASLILINPVHIYWGRTALIETLAVFLATAFLWAFVRAVHGRGIASTAIALALGCLAGLVKPTTFAPALTGAFLAVLHLAYVERGRWLPRDWIDVAIRSGLLAAVPMAATYFWTTYCDGVKSLHPFQPLISSSAEMREWNHGSFGQRLDWRLWQRWIHDPSGWVIGLSPFMGRAGAVILYVACGVAILLSKWRIFIALSLLAIFLSGPILFFPLYHHEYYQVAVTIWSCGILTCGLYELIRRFPVGVVLLPALMAVPLVGYARSGYMTMQERSATRYAAFLDVARFIEANTDPERDALLVLGQDWSSEFAYYTRRKTRMQLEADLEALTDPRFLAMCKELNDSGMRFGAIAVPWPISEEALSHLLKTLTPSGAPTPAAERFPLSPDRFSAWPIDPRDRNIQAGSVYIIPQSPPT